MTKSTLPLTYPNPDLEVIGDNKGKWNHSPYRRYSFQNFSKIFRYGLTFRSAAVMELIPAEDPKIGQLDSVRQLVEHPFFNGLCVVNGNRILFERYARDFSPQHLHSIQSISKTMVHLLIGQLLAQGKIKLSDKITDFVPEVAKGYGQATIQQTLDMDVENDYSENFADNDAEYYYHEEAMGWRLPLDLANEDTQRKFLPRIENTGKYPASPFVKYKDANTEVLIWLIERVSGKPLRNHLADIIDAAGIESHFAMSCDRDGVPVMDGGGCFTLRDLARYGTIFTRGGVGINGVQIGNGDWTRETLKGGIVWSDDTGDTSRYHNHLDTDGRGIGHGGYCGQYLYADLTSGTVVVHFSVTTEKDGICDDHYANIWAMMQEVTRL